MKKYLFIIVLLFFASNFSIAQLSLAHHYPGNSSTQSAIVNLSRSGKKIMVMAGYSYLSDTLYFYNMDYSFWKMIPSPHINGMMGSYNCFHELGTIPGVYYPSETLFNTDTLLEVGILFSDSVTGGSPCKIFIINEHANIVDSITNVQASMVAPMRVYKDTSGAFKAMISKVNGVDIYDLPGSLPCETCVTSSLSTAMLKQPDNSIITEPLPNPSKDEVKITFSLPEGATIGELQLFNSNGQKIKTCKVDNRFGFIILDNSVLPSGLYYYNIVVNGTVSSTQKLLVVK
jgi:hypothetical protein